MKKIQLLLLTLFTPFRIQASLNDFIAKIDARYPVNKSQADQEANQLMKDSMVEWVRSGIMYCCADNDSSTHSLVVQFFDSKGQKDLSSYLKMYVPQVAQVRKEGNGLMDPNALCDHLFEQLDHFMSGNPNGNDFTDRIDWKSWTEEWAQQFQNSSILKEFENFKKKCGEFYSEPEDMGLLMVQGKHPDNFIFDLAKASKDEFDFYEWMQQWSKFPIEVTEAEIQASKGAQLKRVLKGAEIDGVISENLVTALVKCDKVINNKEFALISEILSLVANLTDEQVLPKAIDYFREKVTQEKETLEKFLSPHIRAEAEEKREEKAMLQIPEAKKSFKDNVFGAFAELDQSNKRGVDLIKEIISPIKGLKDEKIRATVISVAKKCILTDREEKQRFKELFKRTTKKIANKTLTWISAHSNNLNDEASIDAKIDSSINKLKKNMKKFLSPQSRNEAAEGGEARAITQSNANQLKDEGERIKARSPFNK